MYSLTNNNLNLDTKRKSFALDRGLVSNVCRFVGLLRSNGIGVGNPETLTALRALTHWGLSSREEFYDVLLVSMAKDPADIKIFDRLFETFWFVWDESKRIAQGKAVEKPVFSVQGGKKSSLIQIMEMTNSKETPKKETRTSAYSEFANIKEKNFQTMEDSDYPSVLSALSQMAKKLRNAKSRRYSPSNKGERFDVKKNFRDFGLLDKVVRVSYKSRKIKKNKFVFLLDVSRSMEVYSHFLLLFLFVFKRFFTSSHALLFSTELHYIGQGVNRRNIRDFGKTVAKEFPEWAGGTRIGQVFEKFNAFYTGRITTPKTIVIVLSDGMDEANGEAVAENMKRLHDKVSKIVWLNPLMGYKDYRPETLVMKAAMPFIDLLAPAHNVKSLESTCKYLLGKGSAGKTLQPFLE